MSPGSIKAQVVLEKVAWTRSMLESLQSLPVESLESFLADARNPAAAESYLRRALESLLDLGRHVLAKGFGIGVVEYKEIAAQLTRHTVLTPMTGDVFVEMAGYRNRLTHFYHEVAPEELYQICTLRTEDIEAVLGEVLAWLKDNPELLDRSL
jgi:uncharacterized protein YutE (UPF0331/DUF86 family)